MTLVVARAFRTEVRIVSDTLLTPEPLHADVFYGALKCVAISPSCCVCYANSPDVAEAAIRPVIGARNASRRDLVAHFLERHRSSNQAADFLVAFADENPRLVRIADGDASGSNQTAWIGDHVAFGRFQELFGGNALTPDSAPRIDDEWRYWVSRMNDAMDGVIEDPNVPSVGGFLVTVTSLPAERDGFRYLARSAGDGFHPVELSTTSKSLMRPLGAAGGGYRYTLLVPDAPGVAAIGVYVAEASAGTLLLPTRVRSPVVLRGVSRQEFIAEARQKVGVGLEGVMFDPLGA